MEEKKARQKVKKEKLKFMSFAHDAIIPAVAYKGTVLLFVKDGKVVKATASDPCEVNCEIFD